MRNSALAKRYARALMDLAGGPGESRLLIESLSAFSIAVKENNDLQQVLANPSFRKQRLNVVKEVASTGGLNDLAIRAVEYLIIRDRIQYLDDIIEAINLLNEKAGGKLRAKIISAKELPEDRYQRIRAALERITGGMIVLEKTVDPEIIGGVIARVGSVIYDGSIRSQLRHFNTGN